MVILRHADSSKRCNLHAIPVHFSKVNSETRHFLTKLGWKQNDKVFT